MPRGFQVHPSDNVVTVLDGDAPAAAPLEVIGPRGAASLTLVEPVPLGHKAALRAIAPGEAVIKYGIAIGIATRAIAAGEWVHIQNCRSQVDQRSSTFDAATGAATDTAYD